MSARELVRDWLPPAVLRAIRQLRGKLPRFAGQFASWSEAEAASSGYSAAAILKRVVAGTRAVVAGEAAYERDGMLFERPDLPFPLLSALLRAATAHTGELRVIDFGGSLGSTYRQCRPFLDHLKRVDWTVIEQAGFVAAGQEFVSAELRFAGALSEVPPASQPAVLLASSVLQYLEDPYAILREVSASPAIRYLVIDRTPMGEQAHDRLCVQHVPKFIYDASYPCRIFSRRHLLAQLGAPWRLVCDFLSPEGAAHTADGLPFEFRGLILEKSS